MKNQKQSFVYAEKYARYASACDCGSCKKAKRKEENTNFDWYSASCSAVAKGLKRSGFNVNPFFKKSDLNNLPLTKKTIVRGTVGITRHAFDLLGVKQPPNIDIPDDIKSFANREIWHTTFGQIKNRKKVFIKPLYHQKAFNGFVYDNRWKNNRHPFVNDTLPNNFPLLAQEVVNFDSSRGEWRVYVLNKKILGMFSYNSYGRDREMSMPPRKFLNSIIKAYKSQPISYTLDCAFMNRNGKLIPSLVEVNDAFSAGHYSPFDIFDFTKFFKARWEEIVRN